jgi:hypothetical protein
VVSLVAEMAGSAAKEASIAKIAKKHIPRGAAEHFPPRKSPGSLCAVIFIVYLHVPHPVQNAGADFHRQVTESITWRNGREKDTVRSRKRGDAWL